MYFFLFRHRPLPIGRRVVLAPLFPRFISLSLPPPPCGRSVVRSLLVSSALVAPTFFSRISPPPLQLSLRCLATASLASSVFLSVMYFLRLRLVVVVVRLVFCSAFASSPSPCGLWGGRKLYFIFRLQAGYLLYMQIKSTFCLFLYIFKSPLLSMINIK